MDNSTRIDEATQHAAAYEPPTITDLGTLAELTLGGAGGTADGVSGVSGGGGSVTLGP